MPDKRLEQLDRFIKPMRVEPGRRIRLPKDFDPGYTADFVKKEQATEMLQQGVQWLSEFQMRLAAQDTWSLLVIFQAMDAAGKDGTIRHVMSGVNPQGVEVTSFKVPSELEQDHDYLWRAALRLPARGMIGIFNRSYYEETLVVRVHPQILAGQRMPPKSKGRDVWKRRFREINDWERYLTDNGTKIVKLFLNVSQGRAAPAVPRPDRGAREQLEVLRVRCARAALLGRLPEGVRGRAVEHEHAVGAVARHPRGPQVVHADRVRGGDPRRADGDRPEVPEADPRGARRDARREGGAARRGREAGGGLRTVRGPGSAVRGRAAVPRPGGAVRVPTVPSWSSAWQTCSG